MAIAPESDQHSTESREHSVLESIINTIPHSIFWKDCDSTYLGCNQTFAQAAGINDPKQIVGLSDYDLPWSREEADFYRECDQQVIGSGEAMVDIEESQTDAAGRPLTLLTSKVPLSSDDGAPLGVLGIFLDITERKRLEEDLARARRLESIGALAAGVAHEINTPLQYVSGNIEYLSDATPATLEVIDELCALLTADNLPAATSERRELVTNLLAEKRVDTLRDSLSDAVDQCGHGASQVLEIVRAMKDLSHPGASGANEIDLSRLVENAVTVTRHQWKQVGRLELRLAEESLVVHGFGNEISQVVVNLVINAVDAVADYFGPGSQQGLIRVQTQLQTGGVEIVVEDNGPGIPAEHRERLFDPFFTTKEVGRGTGQGLAICHATVVGRHAGRIVTGKSPLGGARFAVFLPTNGVNA